MELSLKSTIKMISKFTLDLWLDHLYLPCSKLVALGMEGSVEKPP